jgi:hypothetical protein
MTLFKRVLKEERIAHQMRDGIACKVRLVMRVFGSSQPLTETVAPSRFGNCTVTKNYIHIICSFYLKINLNLRNHVYNLM